MSVYQIPRLLKNKYLLAAGALVVWMVFFDDRDIITTHFKHRHELQRLQESRAYYEKEIKDTRRELDKLRSDAGILEKYAREKYRMKRDNEDIFIIPD
ncbi:MAG: septum formation initiator family protein [Flavitalea sp.]